MFHKQNFNWRLTLKTGLFWLHGVCTASLKATGEKLSPSPLDHDCSLKPPAIPVILGRYWLCPFTNCARTPWTSAWQPVLCPTVSVQSMEYLYFDAYVLEIPLTL